MNYPYNHNRNAHESFAFENVDAGWLAGGWQQPPLQNSHTSTSSRFNVTFRQTNPQHSIPHHHSTPPSHSRSEKSSWAGRKRLNPAGIMQYAGRVPRRCIRQTDRCGLLQRGSPGSRPGPGSQGNRAALVDCPSLKASSFDFGMVLDGSPRVIGPDIGFPGTAGAKGNRAWRKDPGQTA